MCSSGWKAQVCGGKALEVVICWAWNCSQIDRGVGDSITCVDVKSTYRGGNLQEVLKLYTLSSPVFNDNIFLIMGNMLSRASDARRAGAERFWGFAA
jgi:hypothetical protein